MPGSFKTEAVVLRSIRFGEADRVLHLYTPDRGRVGAVAKGARRLKSRLGGRLEPLARVRLVMHEGRGELCTVTQADTVNAHPALRDRRGAPAPAPPGPGGGGAPAHTPPPPPPPLADTVNAHRARRAGRAARGRAVQALEGVLPLFTPPTPNRPAYNLLCNELALLDADPDAATRSHALAFRMKLLLAAGFAPEL